MSIAGARRWLALCVLVVAGGCASVPPAPHPTAPGNGDNEYNGWLFNSLTGHPAGGASVPPAQPVPPTGAPTAQPIAPANVSAAGVPLVQPVPPANLPTPQPVPPAGDEVGPMIPGPAAQPRWRGSTAGADSGVIRVAAEGVAGPPPSVPPDLPPPTNSVSIVGVKPDKPEEEKKTGFQFSDLAPEALWLDLRKATGHGPDEKIARAAMLDGIALYRAKKYAEAALKFAIAADRWPDSPLEEDALFLKGESEFFADQYSKAHDTFGGLLKKYPNPRQLDAVAAREFAIGRYWEQCYNAKPTWPTTPNLTDNSQPMFDRFGWAVDAYNRVAANDPSGPLADAAKMALGNLYFRDYNFEAAAEHYGSLIKSYPNSKYQMTAHVFDLQAEMRIYQGPDYDEEPLKRAKKIAEQSLSQFGDKLGKEQQRIRQAHVRIVEEQANREFQVAKYYERRSCYGSARFYYKCVMDEYPTTQKAKEAKEQFEKIRTLPDEPPKYFKWLTDLIEPKQR